jgi:acetyltransferase-like isoleucine patch superfamily enzyme
MKLKIIIEALIRTKSIPLGTVKIGDYTTGTPLVISRAGKNVVEIGKFCSISPEVTIIPSLGHIPSYKKNRNYRVSTYPLHDLCGGWKAKWNLPGDANFVIVGNDVWIGTKAILLPGITIGDGSIIGAGAVVAHDVPPYAIVAGVPAKIIQFRYSQEQINRLLKIAWWNWDIDKIRANVDHFYGDIDLFIKKFFDPRSWPI